jgi:hypothetical protein
MPQQVYTPDLVCALRMDVPADDPTYLPSLQRRYQTAATRVLLYVSPVRACDENVAAYRALAERLHVKPPEVYDPHEFTDAWHLNPAGATRNSIAVAQEIRAVLEHGGEGSSAKTGSRGSASSLAARRGT